MSSKRLLGCCAFAVTVLSTLAVTGATDIAHAQWPPYGPYGQYGQRSPYDRDFRRDQYNRDQRRNEPGRDTRRGEEHVQIRTGSPPLLAVVSLSDQRVTFYGADGKIVQSPVSTGQTGFETPAGIFTIVQKKEEHRSNIYEDGNMPFMQRITWTGIALHGGELPGRPASHGCVRLPHGFARQLFGLTDMGLRVVIVRDDVVPADISHPSLFKPRGGQSAPALTRISAPGNQAAAAPGSTRHMQMLKSAADAKSAEAEAASRRAKQARQVAQRKAAEAAPVARTIKAAETNQSKAEAALKAAEGVLGKAASPEATEKAEAAKAKAAAKVAETLTQVEAAKSQAQAKADAAARAEEDAKAAEAAGLAAIEAAGAARRKLSPISVLVSRNTQRIYVRQANEPLYEAPVTIRDPDAPIGSYVFTALNYLDNGADVRWNVVSMYRYEGGPVPPAAQEKGHRQGGSGENAAADLDGAKAALDRISFPPDVVERVSELVLPGSSLIISDERASIETGKDTDFVVLMSGEPQGALKTRKRELIDPSRNDPWRNGPWGGGGYGRRGGGGGGFPFFW